MYAAGLSAGLKPKEFWSMTPVEFSVYLDGVERRKQEQYDCARLAAWGALAPHTKKGQRLLPKDLCQLPMLDMQVVEMFDMAAYAAKCAKIKKLWGQKQNT